jgi:hypothetical protein
MDMENKSAGIDCETFKNQLESYIEGKLEDGQMELMDEHARDCPKCRQLLDNEEENLVDGSRASVLNVKKLESRFATRVFGRFVTVAVIVFMVWYVIFTALPQTVLSKQFMRRQLELTDGLEDLVQFTMPGAKVKSGWKGYIGLLETIGVVEYEQQLIKGGYKEGKYDLAVPNYIGSNDWRTSNTVKAPGDSFSFNFPHTRGDGSSVDMSWNMLREAEKGTVSSVAVYFEKPVTVQEMDGLLASLDVFGKGSYDMQTWIAIDTQPLSLTRYGYGNAPLIGLEWGFPLQITITNEEIEALTNPSKELSKGVIPDIPGGKVSFSSSVNSYQVKLDKLVSQAMERWSIEMKNFEGYSKQLGTGELTEDINKINNSLKKGEVQIRGAILTAPTSNLLKLADNKNIARVEIMKVDFDYLKN